MIYLEKKHEKIVRDILKKYPYTFYIYGSRAKGTHRPHSDLDICFKESIPLSIQAQIEEEFTESDLPFEVDFSDYNLMQESFKDRIKKSLVVFQEPK